MERMNLATGLAYHTLVVAQWIVDVPYIVYNYFERIWLLVKKSFLRTHHQHSWGLRVEVLSLKKKKKNLLLFFVCLKVDVQ